MTEDDVRDYLDNRVSDPKSYRGMHIAQHNRIGAERLVCILQGVAAGAGDRRFAIPPGDDPASTRKHAPGSAHPLRGSYLEYFAALDAINRNGVGVTFNSLKKNHFPNLEDMGLLERREMPGRRFDGQLTAEALAIVAETDVRRRHALIGQAAERLFAKRDKDFLTELFSLLGAVSSVSDIEMMLFVSDRTIDQSDHEALIRAFRRTPLIRRVMLLSDYERRCRATDGLPKVARLDWGNWRNQAQQIISLLPLVSGFLVPQGLREQVVVRADRPVPPGYMGSRSSAVKDKALELHSLVRRSGCELHHVVPVEYATCDADMQLIDAPENLIYVTQSAHKRFKTSGNTTIRLGSITPTEVCIEDLAGSDSIVLKTGEDVFVSPSAVPLLKDYNAWLLASIGG